MKIFVIDLDGTLLSDSGHLEPDVASSLIQVQKMGYRILIASGRTYTEAKDIIDALELKNYNGAAVLADGQYVFDYSTGEEYVRERLTAEDIRTIINWISASDAPIKVFCQHDDYLIFRTKYCFKYLKYFIAGWIKKGQEHLLTVKQVDRIIEADKIAVNAGADVEYLKDAYEVAYINDKSRYEIKQRNVNKASSVRQVLGNKNDDVFVFGNDENDICLFKAFPDSYVMENSMDTVKNYAKHIIHTSKGECVVSQILQIINLEGMK